MSADSSSGATPDHGDARLYAAQPEGWEVHIKQTWEKEYCHARMPGDDYFHLLLCGEIYLVRGTEKFCLQCATRRGVITRDRLHWQHGQTSAGNSAGAFVPAPGDRE